MSLIQTLVLPKISDGLIDVLTISGAVLSIFVITVLYKFYTDAMAAGPSPNALIDQIDRDNPSDPAEFVRPVIPHDEDSDNLAVGASDWDYDNMRDFTSDDADDMFLKEDEKIAEMELMEFDDDQQMAKEDRKNRDMSLMEEAH